jgi:hypothetical protein
VNEEPLVNMEVVSNETDPLLFRYSKAPTTNHGQDVYPFTWCEVQVRIATEVITFLVQLLSSGLCVVLFGPRGVGSGG